MKRASLLPREMLAGLFLGISALAGPCPAQTDDFDDGNDDGWSRFDPLAGAPFNSPAAWSFPPGAYRIAAPPNPLAPAGGPARAASLRQDVIYTSFCVMVDIVAYGAGLPEAIGVMARVQPNPMLGDTDGYTFTYQPEENDVQISLIINEEPTAVGPSAGLPFVPGPGTTLHLVLFGHGDYLEGRIYDTSDLLNPLAVTYGYDDTYSTGTCGLVVSDFSKDSNGPADATFDNYAAHDGSPPPLVITRDGPDGVTLTWPDSTLCRVLQTSPAMLSGTWSDVTTGIAHDADAGTFSLTQTFAAGGPKRFWRWWVPE